MMEQSDKKPKISVCVVTYNHANYIRQCLQSIVDQATEFDYEVIVGDDCSTDGTHLVVQEFAERYPGIVKAIVREENVGPYGNYLDVHGRASGEFVCHCDGDDYWLTTKLQTQVTFMEQHPACKVSGHRMYLTDSNCRFSEDEWDKLPAIMEVSAFYKYGNFLAHSSTMYRSSCGPLPDANDDLFDFLAHIWRINDGALGFIGQHLGVYRRHEASMSNRFYESLLFFDKNLIALEEIHKVVKNNDQYEERKFALCVDYVKNFIVNGRRDLANEIAVRSRYLVAKRSHSLLLQLMVFFSFIVSSLVQAKRRYR
jgi:glycosyltransferase involved in cell wall biosynthesis